MPRYADEEGITALTETLGGNGVNQFNAIWHYLIRGSLNHPNSYYHLLMKQLIASIALILGLVSCPR